MNNAYIRLLIFLYTAERSSADYEIARTLLKAYPRFPDILIEEIATMSHTTPASVTKFCHKLQYKSFKELRCDCSDGYKEGRWEKLVDIAAKDDAAACDAFLEDEQHKLLFYMQQYDEEMLKSAAKELLDVTETAVLYTHYCYPCTHVLRRYLQPFQIQVQGIKRDVPEDFIEKRLEKIKIVFLISLSGEWITEHAEWLERMKEKGITFIVITAVYDNQIRNLSPYIFPFHFYGDTLLDTNQQISCLFAKLGFHLAKFSRIGKK